MTQLTGLFCISSQWACCSTFKYLASACCSSCSALQKPSTFPSSTCIDLLQGDFMYVTFHICFMCSSSSIKSACRNYMLTEARLCGCIGSSSKVRQDQKSWKKDHAKTLWELSWQNLFCFPSTKFFSCIFLN